MKPADLRAIVEKMTPGPYRYNEDSGDVESPTGGPTPYIAKSVCRMFIGNHSKNAAGIVALCNHAKTLIDLAEAVRVWRDTECDNQSADTDDYTIAADAGNCAGDTHAEACPEFAAWDKMINALAKFEAIP